MRTALADRRQEPGPGRVRGERWAVRGVSIARVTRSPVHLETPAMKPTQHISAPPGPNGSPSAALSPAVRSTLWVLGPLAIAVPVSVVLVLAGAGADWIGALWLAAVLWTIAASFVQALWQGLRHGDWSAFTYVEVPRNEEDVDFSTRTGRYAYIRNQADDEALMREDERFLKNHDHNDSRA